MVLLTAVDIFFQAVLCYEMYECAKQPNTSVGDIYWYIQLLLRATIYIVTFIGIYKLIKRKSIELVDEFKLSIFYSVIVNIFWYLLLLLSKENSNLSHLHLLHGETWHGYALFILNAGFVILVCIYFFNRTEKKETNTAAPAIPKARFINWIIDFALISFFTLSHFSNFQRDLILLDFFTQRESIQILFFLNTFLYYFVLESLFLQTIGKLHNNSFVEYDGNRFTAILTRTLCRFIPFEAFTCFNNKGWHDLISKTRVVLLKKEV
ncbi:hypothetical protein [Cytophaga aurantiaca]|uniref:hypothetical protein n=1 Tax=Cytophaga aurantiaca TaxID=29530 RepID=UPI0012F8C72E|nr:hypothetical protein [Cytophaga aurantiaca]